MINQEKVLRMTKMASYEEHGGRKDRAVVGYFAAIISENRLLFH